LAVGYWWLTWGVDVGGVDVVGVDGDVESVGGVDVVGVDGGVDSIGGDGVGSWLSDAGDWRWCGRWCLAVGRWWLTGVGDVDGVDGVGVDGAISLMVDGVDVGVVAFKRWVDLWGW
jgi:hypothetical protein